MIEMGRTQELILKRRVTFGVYLSEAESPEKETECGAGASCGKASAHPAEKAGEKGVCKLDDAGKRLPVRGVNENGFSEVLLPLSQVPAEACEGDVLSVFIYRDSKDRPIATTRHPLAEAGQVAVMEVKALSRLGAFLDWGLEKDLFLPYREMIERPEPGQHILVRVYVDKSGRMAASMRGLYHLLSTDSPYQTGDAVKGRVYERGHDFGTFVAVDNRYSAMLPRHEAVSCRIGTEIEARVCAVKPDGKLDLTLRAAASEQIEKDADHLRKLILSYGGVLPFTERADSSVIQRETGLSKAAFKRAVGRLYRQRLITLENGVIRLKEEG